MHRSFFFLGFIAMVGCGEVTVPPGDSGGGGGTTSGNGGVGGDGPFCTPDALVTCDCPQGGSGVKACAHDGSGFGECTGCGQTVGAGGAPPCVSKPGEDQDGDGFTANDGDCNDCDPQVGPGAIELPTSPGQPPRDEDCDGSIDEPPTTCDDGLTLDDTNPVTALKAIDLCQIVGPDSTKKWGVIAAQYTRADGTPMEPGAQTGIQAAFGPAIHVQRGAHLLALSTGHARTPQQPDACGLPGCVSNNVAKAPAGFPIKPANCPTDDDIADDVALEVTLRAPTNASAYAFDSFYLSFDSFLAKCTEYTDHFVAIATPAPAGAAAGNVLFDDKLIPPSPNFGFMQVCANCPQGDSALLGTGFAEWGPLEDSGSGSGWLRTTVPVTGGEVITLRFAIWDGNDGGGDSTALIDNVQWLGGAAPTTPSTALIPAPK